MNHPKVLLLDKAGIPMRWGGFKDFAYYYSKDRILWESGQFSYDIKGGTNKNGQRSTIEVASIAAVDTSNSKVNIDINKVTLTNNNDVLFRRDDYICAYCSKSFNSNELSRDHVHPVSKGGLDIWENVVTSCKKCNHSKGNMSLSKWGNYIRYSYDPYTPYTNICEQLIIQNSSILQDQYDYLEKGLPGRSKFRKS